MKKKILYPLVILSIITIVMIVVNFQNDRITVNNVPLNGYKIDFTQSTNKFYFSRSSNLNEYESVNKKHITLNGLQPSTTYYYKINKGKVHELNTVKDTHSLHKILANAKNAVFVFDGKLNLLYKIKALNLSDSVYFNGYTYVAKAYSLSIYKDKSAIKTITLKQKPKKFVLQDKNLYLSIQNSIYKINDFKLHQVLKTDNISYFYPYDNGFIIYDNNKIYFKNKTILKINDLSSMTVKGRYLFVSSFKGNVFIIDLQNNKTMYTKSFKIHLFTIYTYGNGLYIGGTGKIIILNIKDFSKIRVSKEIETRFSVSDIKIFDDKLISCEGDKGISIIDLKNYKVQYSFDNGVFAYGITFFNGKYYITDPYEGIKVYDKNFKKVSNIDINGKIFIIHSTNNFLVVGVDKQLFVYDKNMKLVSKIDLKEIPTDIEDKYQYLFVSEHNEGFQIINMENPKKPIIAETILSGGDARNLFFKDGNVYLANGRTLNIYSINMIINYEEKSKIKINGNAFDCVVNGNILYIDNLNKSILLYDVSDPEKPRYIGEKKVNYKIVSMTLYKDYLICSGGFEGIKIYKNSGASLKLYKNISDGSYYDKTLVQNNSIIALKGESGFDVLDTNFKIIKSVDWIFLYSARVF